MSYNMSKLEPKLKSHQFPGFLNGLPTYDVAVVVTSAAFFLLKIRSCPVYQWRNLFPFYTILLYVSVVQFNRTRNKQKRN